MWSDIRWWPGSLLQWPALKARLKGMDQRACGATQSCIGGTVPLCLTRVMQHTVYNPDCMSTHASPQRRRTGRLRSSANHTGTTSCRESDLIASPLQRSRRREGGRAASSEAGLDALDEHLGPEGPDHRTVSEAALGRRGCRGHGTV